MSDSEFEDFGQQIADACEAFLLGLQAIAHEEDGDLVHDVHLQGPSETVFLRFPGHVR